MQIKTNQRSFLIFDLDDTLLNEFDFLVSAYRSIAASIDSSTRKNLADLMVSKYLNGENVFAWVVAEYSGRNAAVNMERLLESYRNHLPKLKLRPGVIEFLDEARKRKIPLGLITDGRSITQRNKMQAAGIADYFDEVVISEEFGSSKPNPANFIHFETKYPDHEFWYFGDNTHKDFVVPGALGWHCVCVKDCGINIHKQQLELIDDVVIVASFREIHFEQEIASATPSTHLTN